MKALALPPPGGVDHLMNPDQSSSSAAPPIARPTALDNSGRVLSGQDFQEHTRKMGLCPRCGETRTHVRVKTGMRITSKLQPVTSRNRDGSYATYKGYCLGPRCYRLPEVKTILGESVKKKKNSKSRNSDHKRDKSLDSWQTEETEESMPMDEEEDYQKKKNKDISLEITDSGQVEVRTNIKDRAAKKRNDRRRDAAKDNAWDVDHFSSLEWTDFGTNQEFQQTPMDDSFFSMMVKEPSFRGKQVTIHVEPSLDEVEEEPDEEPIVSYQALRDENPASIAPAALKRRKSSEIFTIEEEYPDPSVQVLEEDEDHEEDEFDVQLTALVASRSRQNIFESPQRTKYHEAMRPSHPKATGRNKVLSNTPPSSPMSIGSGSTTPSVDDAVAETWLLAGTMKNSSSSRRKKESKTKPGSSRIPRHSPNVEQTRAPALPPQPRTPALPPQPRAQALPPQPRTPDHYGGEQSKSRSKSAAATPSTAASTPSPLRGYSSNGRVTPVSTGSNTSRFANSVSSGSGPVDLDDDDGPVDLDELEDSSQDASELEARMSTSNSTRDRSGPVDLDDSDDESDDDIFDEFSDEMESRHRRAAYSSSRGSVDSDLRTRLVQNKSARYSNREVFKQTIAASVIKETKETKTGMVFRNDEDGNVFISKINPRGLFSGTALEVGCQIVSVNNIDCEYKGLDYVASLVRDSRGAVTVVALRCVGGDSGNGTDWRESMVSPAANRSRSSWRSTSTKNTWESQSVGCDENGSVVSEMTDPFGAASTASPKEASRKAMNTSGRMSHSQRWEEEESAGSGFTLTTGARGDISASSSTSGQAYPDKDKSYRHAMNSGVLWLTLVGQHVRFPTAWFNGARAPHLGVSNLRTKNGEKKPQHRWAYIARDVFHSEPILNEFVPNKHSPGRLLMHLVIRDEKWRPVQDVAIGCFHPYSPALKHEKDKDSRVLWLAIRRRSGHRVGSTSLCDPILASECRVEDVAADTPLGRGKVIQNKKLMAIFGDEPPVRTVFVLETELVKKVRASREREYITDFKPITLLLLELFLETRAEL